jgi:ABC-2 type transport system permease protein
MTAAYRLLRLALRRDRVRLAVWLVAVAVVMAGSAASTRKLYPTHADLAQLARTIEGTRATLAFYGPAAQLDTVGGVVLWKPGGIVLVLAGLLGLLTVVRHTRAEEEAGLTELTGAGAVGRLAPLTAGLALAVIASLGLGVLVALGLASSGAGGVGAVGAGLEFAAVGSFFAAVAAVTCQICGSGRSAAGLAGAVLAAAYLVRALADGSTEVGWLGWGSPIGWVQRLDPYAASPRWWVLLLPLGTGGALAALAVWLRARRDLGAALLATRPGPPVAGPRLRGPFGLAWRLQRGVLAAWAVGFGVLGLLVGWLASSVDSFVGNSTSTRDLLVRLGGHHDLADTYVAASLGIAGVAASAYAILAVLRLRTEEEAGRVEPLLAGGVSRTRLVASHLVISLGGVVALLAVLGVAAGLTRGAQAGGFGGQLGRLVLAAVAQAPAAGLLAGVVALLLGLWPRQAALGWAVFGLAVVLGPLGAALDLPAGLQDLSPYAHLPHLPAASVPASDLVGLLVLVLLTALAVAIGLAGYRRRDIPA